MPMRHAQRKHIIHSLNSLLYQLHTISFLLSPRLWPLLCRITTQFQFSRPRDIDSQRSLRFWFILVVVINLQSFYNHIFKGPTEERSIVLDFVGLAPRPSKTFLLCLDSSIVLLEFILITIAYETSFILASPPDTPDPLQPDPIPPASVPLPPLSADESDIKSIVSTAISYENEPEYIVDIRLRPLLQRLRNPPTPPPPQQTSLNEELLPLPNTTSFQISQSINMLVRAQARMRERAARTAEAQRANRSAAESQRTRGRQPGEAQDERRIPGGLGGEGEDDT